MLGPLAAKLYNALTVVQWIIMFATAFVYVAALRGGRMLDQLKRSF